MRNVKSVAWLVGQEIMRRGAEASKVIKDSSTESQSLVGGSFGYVGQVAAETSHESMSEFDSSSRINLVPPELMSGPWADHGPLIGDVYEEMAMGVLATGVNFTGSASGFTFENEDSISIPCFRETPIGKRFICPDRGEASTNELNGITRNLILRAMNNELYVKFGKTKLRVSNHDNAESLRRMIDRQSGSLPNNKSFTMGVAAVWVSPLTGRVVTSTDSIHRSLERWQYLTCPLYGDTRYAVSLINRYPCSSFAVRDYQTFRLLGVTPMAGGTQRFVRGRAGSALSYRDYGASSKLATITCPKDGPGGWTWFHYPNHLNAWYMGKEEKLHLTTPRGGIQRPVITAQGSSTKSDVTSNSRFDWGPSFTKNPPTSAPFLGAEVTERLNDDDLYYDSFGVPWVRVGYIPCAYQFAATMTDFVDVRSTTLDLSYGSAVRGHKDETTGKHYLVSSVYSSGGIPCDLSTVNNHMAKLYKEADKEYTPVSDVDDIVEIMTHTAECSNSWWVSAPAAVTSVNILPWDDAAALEQVKTFEGLIAAPQLYKGGFKSGTFSAINGQVVAKVGDGECMKLFNPAYIVSPMYNIPSIYRLSYGMIYALLSSGKNSIINSGLCFFMPYQNVNGKSTLPEDAKSMPNSDEPWVETAESMVSETITDEEEPDSEGQKVHYD